MKSQEKIYVPISFEYLMSFLFGRRQYHGYVGETEMSRWRSDVSKIAKYLGRAIKLNIVSDRHHKRQLIETCEALGREVGDAKSVNMANVAAIEHLTKLAFMLIGDLPTNWDYKSPYTDRFWTLNKYRSHSYFQTEEQKGELLLLLLEGSTKHKIDTTPHENIRELFWLECKSNHLEFLQWIKENHPSIYCEYF